VSHRHSKIRKDNRRRKAEERATKWAELSAEQQLKILDSRPGDSEKQRKKLLKKLGRTE
jgi:hypothetical protein